MFFSVENGPCLGWRPKPDLPYIWITYSQVGFDFDVLNLFYVSNYLILFGKKFN